MMNTTNTETRSALAIATTVIAQLGGVRIFAMAFASSTYGYQGDAVSVVFKIAPALVRGTKGRATHVTVQLQADDTYTVWTSRVTRRDCSQGEVLSFVYADQLRSVVESMTGLRLSL
jgi:hypothetical protein